MTALTITYYTIGAHPVVETVYRHRRGHDHRLRFVPSPDHNIDHAARVIAGDMGPRGLTRQEIADRIRKVVNNARDA